jgi:hypothetical protein
VIRILKWLMLAVLVAMAALAVMMRMVGDDAAVWHVDPATAERTGRPNDYLVAPEGVAAAPADRVAKVHETEPRALLFQFDAVARPAGAKVVAGSVDDLWITYVQRSMVFGFPDYISVRAVEVEGGSALVIWSRSRYGQSDLGVNKQRIDGWLTQIGD